MTGAWRPVVVMGPTASGKSTVGLALADAWGALFIDGDALHPQANIDKMAAGVPLEDADRWGWLDAVGHALVVGPQPRVVVACSALRRAYRDRIRTVAPATFFLELSVSPDLALARSQGRTDHFMPPSLVASQLATLEPLQADEHGLTVDAALPVAQIVTAGVASLA